LETEEEEEEEEGETVGVLVGQYHAPPAHWPGKRKCERQKWMEDGRSFLNFYF